MSELPKGWEYTTLGNVTDKVIEKIMPADFPDYKFIGMDSITPNSIIPHRVYSFRELRSAGNKFHTGDILYGRMRPYLNKVCKANFIGACSGEYIVMTCNENLLPDFLLYLLHHRSFVKYVNEKTTGDRPRVTYEEISYYPILLPPLNEQRRIVTKIDELFSSLDKGVESLKIAQAQLKIYRQAVLKWAFEGKLTNDDLKEGELPEGWKYLHLSEIVNKKDGLRRGPFGGAIKKECFVPEGFKVYEQGNAINDDAFRGSYFITKSKFDELSSFAVLPGDFLVSCSGSLGRITQIPSDAKPGIINQALLRIRINNELIKDKYFIHYFRSAFFQKKLIDQSQGTAMVNMVGIKDLKEITIGIPPIEKQDEIIAEIESRLSVCEKLEESIAQSLEQAEALRQSILKKAFEGKLVPQDPNDEPASVLLERIRAERNATVAKNATIAVRKPKKKAATELFSVVHLKPTNDIEEVR